MQAMSAERRKPGPKPNLSKKRMVSRSLAIQISEWELLEKMASRRQLSISQFIRTAIDEYIERHFKELASQGFSPNTRS